MKENNWKYKIVLHSIKPFDNETKTGGTKSFGTNSILGVFKHVYRCLKDKENYKVHVTKTWMKPNFMNKKKK